MHVAYSVERTYKNVGSSRQLFIDNDVIAAVKNITRRQHTPQKHNSPLIRRDRPWEENTYFRTGSFNVVWDPEEKIYKCWYEDFYDYFGARKGRFQRSRIHYAESEDGIEWLKPTIGKYVVNGYDDNNTVIDLSPEEAVSCMTVLLDPVEMDPSRRFKALYAHRPNRGLCMMFSANGIDWTPYKGNPVFAQWDDDVEILTYDGLANKYILWGRYGGHPGRSLHPNFDAWFAPVWPGRPEGMWGTRRRIYRLESKDCFNWSKARLIFDPGKADNLDDGLYGFVPWRIDELHLGLLTVLHQVDNTLDIYLHHSRDGLQWHRMLEHQPLIPRGDPGGFDQCGIETGNQPFVVGDELRIYYGGMNVHHDWWLGMANDGIDVPESRDETLARNGHHLGLATLGIDRYVSLDATVREGWVETKPVFSTEPRLYINGRCGYTGYIKVEIIDPWNNVWKHYAAHDCQTFTGDNVHHQVRWSERDTVAEIPGAFKLRFYLLDAELYGFQFAES